MTRFPSNFRAMRIILCMYLHLSFSSCSSVFLASFSPFHRSPFPHFVFAPRHRFIVSSFLCFIVSLFHRFFVSSFLRFIVSSFLRCIVASFHRFFISPFLRFIVSSFHRFSVFPFHRFLFVCCGLATHSFSPPMPLSFTCNFGTCSMAHQTPSIAIVGDSYVRRFGEFLVRHSINSLHIQGQRAACFGLGGASLRGEKRITPLLTRAILQPGLQCVILLIGSNDLCRSNTSPSTISHDIECLVRYCLSVNETLRVAVCQIPPRQRPPDALFADRVAAVNDSLRQRLDPLERAEFTRIKGFSQPAPELYCDGVHFAVPGNIKLLRGIRGAVLRALKLARGNFSLHYFRICFCEGCTLCAWVGGHCLGYNYQPLPVGLFSCPPSFSLIRIKLYYLIFYPNK
jgi:lysophospholipase L1-like esterase